MFMLNLGFHKSASSPETSKYDLMMLNKQLKERYRLTIEMVLFLVAIIKIYGHVGKRGLPFSKKILVVLMCMR